MSERIRINIGAYELSALRFDNSNTNLILALPGYTSAAVNYTKMFDHVTSNCDYDAIVLDISGHGETPGDLPETMPAQHFLEIIQVYDWVVDNNPNKEICVMGTSYGGFMATQLTKYRQFESLILRAPALYEPHLFYTRYKNIGDDSHQHKYRHSDVDFTEHPLLIRAQRFKGRTFIMQHELDDICPKRQTDAFVNAFGADSWVAPDTKHGFKESSYTAEQETRYYRQISDWLNKN